MYNELVVFEYCRTGHCTVGGIYMKTCENCKYYPLLATEEPCRYCIMRIGIEKEPYCWEPAIENYIEYGDDIL